MDESRNTDACRPSTAGEGVPFPIHFPPPFDGSDAPVWTGHGFRVGGEDLPILSYKTGRSGWTDDLTTFHETTAGEDHYIDRASRLHTIHQLRRWLPTASPSIIDVGCSSGILLNLLYNEFPNGVIVAADYVKAPLENLVHRLPGMPLVQFDLTTCPLPDQSVDAVVLLNVLEHIERDDVALSQVARILKPAGVAVIEVPAGPQLFDVYDKVLFHHRRYRMSDLLQRMQGCGLQVLDKSHLGFFLYPAFWATKKRGQRYLSESRDVQMKIVSRNITTAGSHRLMHTIMRLEAKMRNWFYYPIGIRCLVTCRRPL